MDNYFSSPLSPEPFVELKMKLLGACWTIWYGVVWYLDIYKYWQSEGDYSRRSGQPSWRRKVQHISSAMPRPTVLSYKVSYGCCTRAACWLWATRVGRRPFQPPPSWLSERHFFANTTNPTSGSKPSYVGCVCVCVLIKVKSCTRYKQIANSVTNNLCSALLWMLHALWQITR